MVVFIFEACNVRSQTRCKLSKNFDNGKCVVAPNIVLVGKDDKSINQLVSAELLYIVTICHNQIQTDHKF